ncbi:MAG: hypothetical protein KatS3mg010_0575 [Acidimicrobiia bacterium]|nr:MAG: hypothetical protein KatS3mg010_0575 [Acidimicrobiia bacterium]
MTDGELPPFPTFLVIGAQKSATRWLRTNLGEHPDVFVASQEVKFFNHPKRVEALGGEWYRAQFRGWAGEPVVGEATPGYMILRHRPSDVATRIRSMIPDVKLVALLRNPVDRAQSALLHHKKQGRVHPRTGLLDHLHRVPPEDDWMGIVTGGWYAASLEPYLHTFGERLRVELHDDVVRDARGVYARVLAHIGAAGGFAPETLSEVVRSNRSGRSDEALSPAERVEAYEFFRHDVERLELMLDRDLSVWKPAPS